VFDVEELIVALFKYSLLTAASVMGPVLLTGLIIGVSVGAIQAATQVNEPTLTFVPKIIGVGFVAMWIIPWGLDRYTQIVHAVARAMAEVPIQ